MSKAKPYDIPKQVVWDAYRRVKANRGAAGVDGQSLEAFEAVGGFSRRVYAAEDVAFSVAAGRWGRRRGLEFRILTDPPFVTSSRKLRGRSAARIYLMFLLLTLFPFLLMSRRFCRFWYTRP